MLLVFLLEFVSFHKLDIARCAWLAFYYLYVCYLCLLVVLVFGVQNCHCTFSVVCVSFFVLHLVLSSKFVVVASVFCYLLIIFFVRYHWSCSWCLLVFFVRHFGVYHVFLFFVVVLVL